MVSNSNNNGDYATMMDEEKPSDTRSIILLAIDNTYNTKKFLELCLVAYTMEDKKKEAKKTEELLSNQTLMRELSIVSTIKETPEERIYYLDHDKSTGVLQYKEELETLITTVTLQNLKTLSKMLKELSKEEEIEL